MDFITTAVISSAAYDIVKGGFKISAERIKEKLSNWIIDDKLTAAVASELQKLEITDDASEKYIERKINESQALLTAIEAINKLNPQQSVIINQNHSGFGDNIARDKIIN